jgi:hypothetical protein
MNRFLIALAFLMTSIFSSHAQLNDFNLSDYKLPDLDRKTIETRFNLNGDNLFEKLPNSVISNFYEINRNYFGSSAFLNYNHYVNNAKYQRNSTYGIDFYSNYYNRKQDGELFNKSNQMRSALYIQTENRRYFEGSSFIEADVNATYSYSIDNNWYKSMDSTVTDDNRQTHTILAYVPLKIGRGRIEEVQDARQAVYILDELAKVERMSMDKTDEEVLEFARHISQLKNKRFFDARLRRIAEIESLDSFLIANDYLLKSDARYFTTLTDFWDYGDRPLRNSGTRFSAAIIPGYYNYNYNYVGEGTVYSEYGNNVNALILDAGLEFKHEKPINLKWQNSIDLNGYVGVIKGNTKDETNDIENSYTMPNIQLEFYQTYGFYPNTRTDMRFSYAIQYVQVFDKSDVEKDILGAEGKGAKASTNISVNYYISPKFRLNFNSTLYYIWQESVDEVVFNFDNLAGSNHLLSSNFDPNAYSGYFKEREFRNSFNLSLIYSIF